VSLREVLRSAARRMREVGIVGNPEGEALTLAAHALGVPEERVHRALVLREEVALPPAFDALLDERLRRVPLQHLTGLAHFRRLTLEVGPGVFVPRPETEVVVDLVLEAADAVGLSPVVVDLCTGSGAIAFAVKDERPEAEVHAVELSPDAYAWADRNQSRLDLEVDLRLGDATDAFPDLEGEVDVVAANPPYIPVGMVPVDPEVRDHDPELALYGGGEDGLRTPLAVAARAAELLRPGGVLVMEHADEQGESLPAALRRTGAWVDVLDHRDLASRPRATVARRAP
jgi:release factor glutamine methyltransferase